MEQYISKSSVIAEIKKLKAKWDNPLCMATCNAIKESINTLEVKEVSESLAEAYLAKFDEKFPIIPTLKGKQLADYKNFLNRCQQIFGLQEWGIHPIQAKLFEKLSLLWATWGAEHLHGIGKANGKFDRCGLTWQDIKNIAEIGNDFMNSKESDDLNEKEYYTGILKRFIEKKEG